MGFSVDGPATCRFPTSSGVSQSGSSWDVRSGDRANSAQANEITRAFEKAFPPMQSASYTVDPETIQFTDISDRTASFTLDADRTIGGFAGPVKAGKETFTGTVDLASGAVCFDEFPSKGDGMIDGFASGSGHIPLDKFPSKGDGMIDGFASGSGHIPLEPRPQPANLFGEGSEVIES